MKKRIAKKIIKTSEVYWFYCQYCDTCKKYKSHPYWTDKWNYYTSRNKYLTSTIHRKVDERLGMSLRRLSQYTKEIINAVIAVQNEMVNVNNSK